MDISHNSIGEEHDIKSLSVKFKLNKTLIELIVEGN